MIMNTTYKSTKLIATRNQRQYMCIKLTEDWMAHSVRHLLFSYCKYVTRWANYKNILR